MYYAISETLDTSPYKSFGKLPFRGGGDIETGIVYFFPSWNTMFAKLTFMFKEEALFVFLC